jgi:hypothetical protein
VIGGATDFHIRAVRFVDARQRIMILTSASAAAIAAPHAMVLVLTVPHSLPFRQSLFEGGVPAGCLHFQHRDFRNSARNPSLRVGRSPQHPLAAPQARKPTSGAMHSPPLHRLTLIPRIAPSGALASRSGRALQRMPSGATKRKSIPIKIGKSLFVRPVSFDCFRPMGTAAFALPAAASRSHAPGLVAAAFGSIS